jgi:hypothetical protein
MFKTRTGSENKRHQLPFRAPAKATDAKCKLMNLLETKGIFVSESDLLRSITKPCFAPHRPHHEQSRAFVIQGPMSKDKLKTFLTPKFLAWAQPLIKSKDVIVELDELSNRTWIIWVWLTHEHLFRCMVEEWDLAARKEEKSSKTGKIPNTTMSVYLTGEEKRALARRAQPMGLKRARTSGESILLRLVASYGLPDFLEFLEARESAGARPSKPAPKRKNPRCHLSYGQA